MTVASDNLFPKLILVEGAAPSTPASGHVKLYVKADGLAYSMDDAGVEKLMSGAALAAITGLAANVSAFLATPSSANLLTMLTDKTGTGVNVHATSPTLVTPNLGTPSTLVLTNATGLPIGGGGTGQTTAYAAQDALSVHGADIASATTTNLDTATGNLVDVTGTTTITGITLADGRERTVRFTGALTLTNGASLVLPGGVNITTVAGDIAIFRGYAAGVVRCVNYSPVTVTGTGSAVRATSPSFTTPNLGTPASGVLTNCTIKDQICVAASDETTAITTGTAKLTFRMPFAMTLTAVRASVTTAPTGSTIIIDINENGTTILSTKLSIDASEKTSVTAASAAVISDAALADDAEITIDFDQVGSSVAGTGVKVWLIGTRA